ncbi:aspartate carbamoyltransferase [Candidatus Pacearchaeota archaeon]|jgi:aspartate carbamoyltransferase catalytic subunit|nr:aspartate carbamoyltransferase [Candidatus Pacearchaeota archaeon]
MVCEKDFLGRDIISINDFSREELEYLFWQTDKIKQNPSKFAHSLDGKIIVPLFFENSTRTDLSFQMAITKLGGRFLDFDISTSSINKGETLRDTIKTIERYEPDAFVLRHRQDGSAQFVADLTNVPVINAGDGKNEHPTQTILDLYTIRELRGKIDGLNIAIAGDLKYGRTTHSLVSALSNYNNCNVHLFSPDFLKFPKEKILEHQDLIQISEHGLSELEEVIRGCDVLYMTRIQRERFPEGFDGEQEYKKIVKSYHLIPEMLKKVSSNFKIMHPLPRVEEIDVRVDKTLYAHYFEEAGNGMWTRMAELYLIVGGKNE